MKDNLKFFKKKKLLPVDDFLQNVLYDKKMAIIPLNNLSVQK